MDASQKSSQDRATHIQIELTDNHAMKPKLNFFIFWQFKNIPTVLSVWTRVHCELIESVTSS